VVPTETELRTIRSLLATIIVAVPALGVLRQLDSPHAEVWWGVRWTFVVISLVVWLASLRSSWVRERSRLIGIALACALQGWYAYMGAQEGMQLAHAVSMVLISALSVLLFRNALEMGAFAMFTAVLLILAYRATPEPGLSPAMFAGPLATVMGSIGLITLSRRRLDLALEQANKTLERRVEERTAALAKSLRRLETEVEERKAAERAALQASQAKSTFLANMSHELRTPLNAILGYTELALEELAGADPTEIEPDLQRVRHSAGHLLRLIDDVLDLSRVEAGKIEVRTTEVDVAALVRDVLEEGARAWPANGNTVTVDIPEGTLVQTDPRHLRQILGNLLSNAAKFTTAGTIRVSARREPAAFVLSVSDTGVGIPASALEKLFTKFVQVDDSPTRRFGGTGLGLALSRELATRLGGTLTVESALGVGSTFTLALPAR
jgi:signal transduction histidine kinase